MSKIYTYYHNIFDNLYNIDDNQKLIELWKDNWVKNGWEPIILTINDAMLNPRFNEYNDKFKTFPTLNNKDYELSCFHRWVAMENIGEGYMCDYDVFNYGFKPIIYNGELTVFSKYIVPCIVYGEKKDYSYALDIFYKYNIPFGCNHVSDQNILAELCDFISIDRIYKCSECHVESNWEEYELIHYPTGKMSEHQKMPKYKFIKY